MMAGCFEATSTTEAQEEQDSTSGDVREEKLIRQHLMWKLAIGNSDDKRESSGND